MGNVLNVHELSAAQLARATPSPGQSASAGDAKSRARSGERRLLLGEATKTVFEVYLGGALRAQLGELSLKVPYPGA